MAFGNVNISYKPCKSVGQLKSAEKYMLGKELSQIKAGVVKTAPDLYMALGCDRDNFSNNVLVTRKLHGKSYNKMKENNILAHKMSISFHPADNDKLDYRMAYEIARQFAEKFMHEKGHEVLFAVHTDSKHVHVHFLVSNCNMHTGKSYRRNKKDLWDMSEYFAEKCLEYGLENSVRDEFYNKDLNRQKDKITFTERKMAERGAETFKEELKEVIREEIQNPKNKNFDDFVKALWENWSIETRVVGNTISYRHPEYKNRTPLTTAKPSTAERTLKHADYSDKNNNLVSIRGSKLGDLFTKKGVTHELDKKSKSRENIHYAGRIEAIANADVDITGARTQGIGGQISSGFAACDIGTDLRSLDSFYERYCEPVKDSEQSADEAVIPARRLQERSYEPSL